MAGVKLPGWGESSHRGDTLVVMHHGTHEDPKTASSGVWGWRVATPLVLTLCGGLLVTSYVAGDGTDLRPERYTDLASLVRAERPAVDALNDRVGVLTREVEGLSDGLGDRSVNRYRTRITTMSDPAGLTPRSGPAVVVTLNDAPADVPVASGLDANDYVVHQQDIQAVVNAMWEGGATAVTLMGQRLISTTGIKCEGNSVTLQGLPYAPPYRIVAIGDRSEIMTSIDQDPSVQVYRGLAASPSVQLGWEMSTQEHAVAPAYSGVATLKYAQPLIG